jgi:hypothetical protein
MTTRTSEKTVTFKRPFDLEGYPDLFPAGTYRVETDEELLEGVSFTVYRRKATLLHLPANPEHPGLRQTLTIDPNRLDAALMRDRMSPGSPADQNSGPEKFERSHDSHHESVNRQSMEASEDDGMIVHPV